MPLPIVQEPFQRRATLLPTSGTSALSPATGTAATGADLPVTSAELAAPVSPQSLAHCAAIWQMTEEMLALTDERTPERRDRRRLSCHARQMAMYVCHVVLRLSLSEIGRAFGRDRTTVGHACHVVEDRRDDPAYDSFVGALERVAKRLVEPAAGVFHG